MKNFHLLAGLSISWILLASPAEAEEINLEDLPQAVREAFTQAYPKAEDVEIDQEAHFGTTLYEIEFKKDGQEYEQLYGEDGTLMGSEIEIDLKDLPETVTNAIRQEYPNATIKEAEKVSGMKEAQTEYEVEIEENGNEWEIYVDADGKILKKERD